MPASSCNAELASVTVSGSSTPTGSTSANADGMARLACARLDSSHVSSVASMAFCMKVYRLILFRMSNHLIAAPAPNSREWVCRY